MLCAYKPKTRQLAMMHAVSAAVLAFICWQPAILTKYTMTAVTIWQGSQFPEHKAMVLLMLLALLSVQVLLLLAYLAIIRHRNLNASNSQEVPALQADIHNMLQALSTLKHVPDQVEALDKTSNAGQETTFVPLASNAQQPGRRKQLLKQLPKQLHQQDSEAAGCRKQPPNPVDAQASCVPSPPQPCTILSEVVIQHAASKASTAEEESGGFRIDVAAALEASSRTIANLAARLETLVYYRSGAHIQGHIACNAALQM